MRRRRLRRRYGHARKTAMVVEGVVYRPYSVSFKTRSGKRTRVTHWSPGQPWLGGEIARMLSERGDVDSKAQVFVSKKGW